MAHRTATCGQTRMPMADPKSQSLGKLRFPSVEKEACDLAGFGVTESHCMTAWKTLGSLTLLRGHPEADVNNTGVKLIGRGL